MSNPEGTYEVGEMPPGTYEQGRSWAQRAVSAVAGPLTNALASGIQGMSGAGLPPDPRMLETSPEAQSIAGAIVPQTPMQVGIMAGTMGAGGLGLRGLMGAGARVLGGTVGGAAGGAVGDEGALGGAVTGLGTTLIGEGVGGGIGLILRARPGGREAVKANDLTALGDAVADYLPSLRGMTPDQIKKATVSAQGFQKELGDRYGVVLTGVEKQIGGQKITVPLLSDQPMTVTEAADALKKIGHAGFGGGKDLNPSIVGRDQRVDWQQALDQITGELTRINPSGEATAAFLEGRRVWAVGTAISSLFKGPSVLRGVPDGVEVNFNNLRAGFERTYRRFERSLLPDEMAAVTDVVYRGGPFGSRDITGPRSGMTDAAARLYRSGGGTATGALVGPRTILPGLGDQYTGRQPYGMGPGSQTGLDMLLQQIGGASLNPLGAKP